MLSYVYYVMYVMLCMWRQWNNYIYKTRRYPLILIAKNANANELQYLGNKTNKQTNKQTYVKVEF